MAKDSSMESTIVDALDALMISTGDHKTVLFQPWKPIKKNEGQEGDLFFFWNNIVLSIHTYIFVLKYHSCSFLLVLGLLYVSSTRNRNH